MPPMLIAAGIGAAGSVLGGVAQGKGAKKAAQASAQSSAAEIAAAERNRDYQYALNAPTIGLGGAADKTLAGLLQIGGDPAASAKAYDQFKASTGYQSRLTEGLSATNNQAFAGGLGRSGANLKALTRFGQDYASNEFGKYAGLLGGVSAGGATARGLVAGVGNNATNTIAQSLAANGVNQGNAAMAGANATTGMIQNLANTGAWLVANRSSYQPTNSYAQPSYTPTGFIGPR